MQTRREANQQETVNENICRIVDNSLQEFRIEIANIIADNFRNLTLANQGPLEQDILSRTERLATERNERENRDDRSDISRDHRNNENRNLDRHFERNSERVLNIIRSWRVRFTGNPSEITVDEFIYRINTLTNANLRGDFNLLCEHAHILFEDKALKWFWRFHRSCVDMDWDELCIAMKRQYKDDKTDFDIRDDILRRKQRHNETFDEFYEVIMVLCDKLRTPLSEHELCETIQRNLKPEVRHEILHLEITRVAHLRRAVRRHEKFIKDMSLVNLNRHERGLRKTQVSEVLVDETFPDGNILEDDSSEICLVKGNNKCWNCDNIGHSFIDCLEPRSIFCYGCGAKNIFKPKCPNCQKRGNVLKDVRSKKDGHPKTNY